MCIDLTSKDGLHLNKIYLKLLKGVFVKKKKKSEMLITDGQAKN